MRSILKIESLKLEMRNWSLRLEVLNFRSKTQSIKYSRTHLQLPTSRISSSGFTLVELIIAISVVAILAVIGLVVFTGFQKGARDIKRKADMTSIARSFEVHYRTGSLGLYPYPIVTDFAGGQIPTDPLVSRSYTGTGAFANPLGDTFFCVCAQLEQPTGNADRDAPAGGCTSPASGSTATYFCLSNQR